MAVVAAKLPAPDALGLKQSVTHCDEALKLDPANVKALVRRGACRLALADLEGASADLLKAAELAPSDHSGLKKELAGLKKAKKLQSEQDKELFGKMFKNPPPPLQRAGLTAAELKQATARDIAEKRPHKIHPRESATESGLATAKLAEAEAGAERLSEAVAFLQMPNIVGAARQQKILYLQGKCKMTAAEVDAAFKQAYKREVEPERPGSPPAA